MPRSKDPVWENFEELEETADADGKDGKKLPVIVCKHCGDKRARSGAARLRKHMGECKPYLAMMNEKKPQRQRSETATSISSSVSSSSVSESSDGDSRSSTPKAKLPASQPETTKIKPNSSQTEQTKAKLPVQHSEPIKARTPPSQLHQSSDIKVPTEKNQTQPQTTQSGSESANTADKKATTRPMQAVVKKSIAPSHLPGASNIATEKPAVQSQTTTTATRKSPSPQLVTNNSIASAPREPSLRVGKTAGQKRKASDSKSTPASRPAPLRRHLNQERLDRMAAMALFEGSLPFNSFEADENPAMAAFLKALNPDYAPPTRDQMADILSARIRGAKKQMADWESSSR